MVTGNDLYKSLGFSLSMKYQSNYYWQSFLINGIVPSVFTVDAALRYTFRDSRFYIKAGGTNLLNHYYYSILGGPQIGGFYYTTITCSL